MMETRGHYKFAPRHSFLSHDAFGRPTVAVTLSGHPSPGFDHSSPHRPSRPTKKFLLILQNFIILSL